MVGEIDHVAYLTDDLEAGIEALRPIAGGEVARRFELPQFALVGAYLARGGQSDLEIFTFTRPDLVGRRRGPDRLTLDHVAFRVDDIVETMRTMRAAGVRFAGADLEGEVSDPFVLASGRHAWTLPADPRGPVFQLIQPAT